MAIIYSWCSSPSLISKSGMLTSEVFRKKFIFISLRLHKDIILQPQVYLWGRSLCVYVCFTAFRLNYTLQFVFYDGV